MLEGVEAGVAGALGARMSVMRKEGLPGGFEPLTSGNTPPRLWGAVRGDIDDDDDDVVDEKGDGDVVDEGTGGRGGDNIVDFAVGLLSLSDEERVGEESVWRLSSLSTSSAGGMGSSPAGGSPPLSPRPGGESRLEC